jgi:hypothetical protein
MTKEFPTRIVISALMIEYWDSDKTNRNGLWDVINLIMHTNFTTTSYNCNILEEFRIKLLQLYPELGEIKTDYTTSLQKMKISASMFGERLEHAKEEWVEYWLDKLGPTITLSAPHDPPPPSPARDSNIGENI